MVAKVTGETYSKKLEKMEKNGHIGYYPTNQIETQRERYVPQIYPAIVVFAWMPSPLSRPIIAVNFLTTVLSLAHPVDYDKD